MRGSSFDQKPLHHLLLRILSDLYDFMGDALLFSLADVLQVR